MSRTLFIQKDAIRVNPQGLPQALSALLQQLQERPAVLVRVTATRGSVPREAGAWMAVFADGTLLGTIGGGRLEYDAQAHALAVLAGRSDRLTLDYALGPALGQCCGGAVQLQFEAIGAADAAALAERLRDDTMPVALFGGGHVGHALVTVLATLPMRLTWIDSRDAIFSPPPSVSVLCEHSDPVQAAVPALERGTRVVIMSFSHAEDLAIVAACLQRQREHADLPYLGLIGSRTKWAKFQARLREQGFTDAELAHVTCPIGIPGIADKRPAVIAVAVAAQLLQVPWGVPLSVF